MKTKIHIACLLLFITIGFNGHSQNDLYKTTLITYAGIPQLTHTDTTYKVLMNTAYVVGYSDKLQNPLWTAYRLGNKKNKSVQKWERPYDFRVDTRTNARVKHSDYTRSGFHRGHMVPNAALLEQYGQMAQLETYFMTNICPQTPKLNQGIWQKLEAKIRKDLSQDDKNRKEVHDMFVIAGPIFADQTIETLDSGVPVPTHFFKIIAFQKGFGATVKAIAFIFPQFPDSNELLDFVVTIDEIETKTGINFFAELSNTKQNNLESKKRNFELKDI